MDSFLKLSLLVISMSVVCYTLPQNDIAENIAEKHGLEINNKQTQQQNQEHQSEDHRIAGPVLGCTIRYETKFEVQHVENIRQECNEWTETICTTKTRPKCYHTHENQCQTKYEEKCIHYKEQECVDNWRKVCETRSKEVCDVVVKEIQVPYVEDDCITRKETRCEKHWEEPIKGKKVWVDNPATCRLYDTTDCQPVTKHRPELKQETECSQVPYQHCDRVKDTQCHTIPKKECKNEPYQDCKEVTIKTCNQESYQDCQNYPRTKCKDVHEKIPKQVAVQVPVRDCSSSDIHHHIPRVSEVVKSSDKKIVDSGEKIVFKLGDENKNEDNEDGNESDDVKFNDVKL
jgi:hypothetical protein